MIQSADAILRQPRAEGTKVDTRTSSAPDVIEITMPREAFRNLRESLLLDTSGIVRVASHKMHTCIK